MTAPARTPWIQTCDRFGTAHAFPLLDPKPEDFRLEDIAHALSRLNRYTGHIIPEHYSVAEHSVRVGFYLKALVRREFATSGPVTDYILNEAFKAGLMHDACETYLNDVSSPLKSTPWLERYKDAEHEYDQRLARRFTLLTHYNEDGVELLREADLSVLDLERPQLLGKPPKPWDTLGQLPKVINWQPHPCFNVWGWRPDQAREVFIRLAGLAGLS